MSISSLRRTNTARRRRAVFCRPFGMTATDLQGGQRGGPRCGRSESEQRECLYAIALIVLGLHCVAALEMRGTVMSNTAIERPRAPEVEFDVLPGVPESPSVTPPSTGSLHRDVRQPTQRVTASPVALRSHSPRTTTEPHRRIVSAHATPAEEPTHSDAFERTPEPALKQMPNEAVASTETARPSKPGPESNQPTSESTPQSVTEPGFAAAYLHNPAPAYPAVALQRGWQGTVFLKVHVLANGHSDHIVIASSSGHESLDDAATEAVANWSFVPARRGEQAIDGWVRVPVDFKLGT
jgi:protein TonB